MAFKSLENEFMGTLHKPCVLTHLETDTIIEITRNTLGCLERI